MKKTLKINNIFRIKDSPQRIARGLSLGVVSGIIPGIGPLTALFLAFLFRANRISALLGSLFTNTWITLLIFPFAIKIGASVSGSDWQKLYNSCQLLISDFHWVNLFKLSVLKIVLPIMAGYIVISLTLGAGLYLVFLAIIKLNRTWKTT